MDAQAEKTKGPRELAFAHLRNAVARHDREAVANISYQLLTAGHKFEEILEAAVSAVNLTQDKRNDGGGRDIASRRRFRYASLVVGGLFLVLPTGALDVASRTQAVSGNKFGLNNEAQKPSEVPNWAEYIIQGVTETVGDGTRVSLALTIDADEGLLNTVQHNSSEPKRALAETAHQTDPPPVYSPLRVGGPRSSGSLAQVQRNDSKAPPSESSAVDLQLYISRGDQLFVAGDVAGARAFYQRAAEYGSAIAAERLGGTYDPKILAQAGLSGLLGNEEVARFWYKRAQNLRDKNR